ncbi:unnamed protein product [Lymnaea stagnalis]|uniref:CUB domain-containing protein n=1 Tax=Lymnaea stagnalis TaxID=6523 RepID=A0AAV2HIQ4_LYMST
MPCMCYRANMTSTLSTRTLIFSVAVLAVTISTCSASWYPSVYYLEDYCGRSLTVRNDVIIKISRRVYLPSNWMCSLTLMPYSGYEVVASFHSYSMSSAYTYSSTCVYEAIQLSSLNNPNILGPYGYCKSYSPSSQYHLTNIGTLRFATGPYSYLKPPSIQLVVNEVYSKNTTGYCTGGRFDCGGRSNQCIDQQLTCNGYDDCANGDDEIGGCTITIAAGVIGAIVAGVFIFVVLVIAVSLLVRRQRLRVAYVQYQ